MHRAQMRGMCANARGDLLLTVSYDKTARLWALPAGNLVRVLRPPIDEGREGLLEACALTSDGSLAAIGGFTGSWDAAGSVYVFETSTGRMVRRLTPLSDSISALGFSRDNRYLAIGLSQGGLRIWETSSWTEMGRDADYGDRFLGMDWLGSEALVTTTMDGKMRLHHLRGGELKLRAVERAQAKGAPGRIRFSPDGSRIAVGYWDVPAVSVHDGQTLKFLYSADMADVREGGFNAVAWTSDGSGLVGGGTWFDGSILIRRWSEAGRKKQASFPVGLNTIMDLHCLADGSILFGTQEPAWGFIGPDGKRTLLGARPAADYRAVGNPNALRVSDDASSVAFGFEMNIRSPATFSITERSLRLLKSGESPAKLHEARSEDLPIEFPADAASPPKLRGKALPLEPLERTKSVANAADASFFLLGTDSQLRCINKDGRERWNLHQTEATWAVNLAADDQIAVAGNGDGTIRWYRADNGKELLAFFPHADRKRWVLWTPEGYYDCSPGGEDLIGWHVNRGKDRAADFFPAAKFRDRFYRPDVLARVLEIRDVAAAVEAADKARGRRPAAAADAEVILAKAAPPVVELAVGGARGEATVPPDAESFKMRYRVRRGGTEPVTRVRLLVDGRPISVEASIPSSDTAEAEAAVPLPAGRNCVITVLAEHRLAVSEPAILRIVRTGGTPPSPASETQPAALKPKLYLLAAGITDYLHNDQLEDLHFAAKDAEDFAQAFQRQEGGLYQKVETKVLSDKEATAANILDGLDWIKQQTTAKDVAVIFFSGHGENDEELRYYFCPHDYDKARRLRSGISFEAIQKTVSSLPGKVLLFIDSCHAGNALGKLVAAKSADAPVDVTRLVNELSGAENGAIVFASSTGRQLSLELSQEKNGAFTKAIVEGLDGQADLRGTGRITVTSLEYFVAERVKELTEGQQTPTVAKPQTVPDFPIAVKRP
ncbi:MAG: hypothetical protein QOE70_1028 [Chthoniobacter sp.]|nr:hypothetical protein [Chthoniobacter sp.]